MTTEAKPGQLHPEQMRQFQMVPIEGAPEQGAPQGETYTPEGEPVPGAQPALSGEMIVGPLLNLVFGIVAERRGDHWKLTETELQELARTGGAVMDHYMPVTAGPLGSFAICMSVALGPRIMVERELIKQRAAEERKRHRVDPEGGDRGD